MSFKQFLIGSFVFTLLSDSACGKESAEDHDEVHRQPLSKALKLVLNCAISYPQRHYHCLEECIWKLGGIVEGSFGHERIADQEEMAMALNENFLESTEKPAADGKAENIIKYCEDYVVNLSKTTKKCHRWKSINNCVSAYLGGTWGVQYLNDNIMRHDINRLNRHNA